VITLLGVDVAALDANGFEVPHGCSRATGIAPVDQVLDRSVRAALYDMSPGKSELELVPALKQAVRDAMVSHFVNEWPRTDINQPQGTDGEPARITANELWWRLD
jgi:hypothetical protein